MSVSVREHWEPASLGLLPVRRLSHRGPLNLTPTIIGLVQILVDVLLELFYALLFAAKVKFSLVDKEHIRIAVYYLALS
jgi:hypothetical protein